MPLLLQGLDLLDADLRANVIEALLAICPNEPTPSGSLSNLAEGGWTAVSEHVGSLISRVLRNATIGPGQVSSVVSLRTLSRFLCILSTACADTMRYGKRGCELRLCSCWAHWL